jgi:hypothetical protein
MLRVNDSKRNPFNTLYQFMCFVGGKCFGKVGAYPFTQVLGLTYINNYIILVKILVYARLVRYRWRYMFKIFCSHKYTSIIPFYRSGGNRFNTTWFLYHAGYLEIFIHHP